MRIRKFIHFRDIRAVRDVSALWHMYKEIRTMFLDGFLESLGQ
jgi:hypothetical protein